MRMRILYPAVKRKEFRGGISLHVNHCAFSYSEMRFKSTQIRKTMTEKKLYENKLQNFFH